jgi:Domain of unknown function (DUF2341)
MAWLSGYDYRKSITVNHSGALTDYQKKIIVNRSSGSDSGDNVYIGSAGCESDYDDIRIATADGSTLLNYRIESSSSSSATIWVKIGSLADGNTTLYLYYGNASASAVSSGANTFSQFDDFPGSSLNTETWDTSGSGSAVVSGGECVVTGQIAAALKTGVGTGCAFRARVKTSHWDEQVSGGSQCIGFSTGISDETGNLQQNFSHNSATFKKAALQTANGWSGYSYANLDSGDWSKDTYYIVEIRRYSDHVEVWIDDVQQNVGATDANYPTGTLKPYVKCNASAEVTTIDFCCIRALAATEPTITAWGATEATSDIVQKAIAAKIRSTPAALTKAVGVTIFNEVIKTIQKAIAAKIRSTPAALEKGIAVTIDIPPVSLAKTVGATIIGPKTACSDPVRAMHGRIKITYSDPSLNETITVTSSGAAYGTSADDTADNIIGATGKYFSLQQNDLTGAYVPMPDSPGWWSSTKADSSGEFDPAITLTVEMEEERPFYDLKVYGDDQLNNFPVDFTVELYDGDDVLLYTETVTANTDWDWSATLDPTIDDVKKIVLSITKINKPNKSAIVTEFFSAYAETYEGCDILSFSVLEERDFTGGTIPIGNVSANEIIVKLDNTDNHFSIDNPNSPIYEMMKKNRRIEAWIGVEFPYDGSAVSYEPLGVFWSQDWSTPQDGVYAEVVGFDRLEAFRDLEFYSSQIYTDYTLSQLAVVVLTYAGLVAAEYEIHADLEAITVPYAWFGRTTVRDALVEIAEACSGTVFTDRDGKVVITPYVNETLPLYTLTQKRYFSKDTPLAFSEIVNYVEVRATPRTPSAEQEIFSDAETLAVPAGEMITVFCIFNTDDPCDDVQTADFTQSGADIHIETQTDYTWATELVFHNSGGTSQNVTGITIDGKILEKAGEKIAVAQDADSIRLNGKQALTTPIENSFIQTKARAQTIADGILAAYKDPRKDVVVQARGYTMSRLGERMTVQSQDGTTSTDYTITRQSILFDGGLRVEMTGQKIPEA